MADEGVGTIHEAFDHARHAAADVFALKLTKAGGVANTRKVAAIAEASGVGLYGGCMLETAVGTAAYAQVYATVPSMEYGCEIFGPLLLKDTITCEQIEIRDYQVWIPPGHGCGVTLDEDKLAFYRRDRTAQFAVSQG
jgi:L-alanine-DL-glutamate epimerase-like enolase superfamily enzyme